MLVLLNGLVSLLLRSGFSAEFSPNNLLAHVYNYTHTASHILVNCSTLFTGIHKSSGKIYNMKKHCPI